MLKKIKKAIANPGKVLSKINSRLWQKNNVDSVLEECLRRSPVAGRRPRILLVAPEYDYGDRLRGLSVEENYFRHTLIHAGYDLVSFDFMAVAQKFGLKTMNKLLLESVYREKPDIAIFVLLKNEIAPQSLLEIRDELGVCTINWFCDDHWRFEDFSRIYAPCFSWAITTDTSAVPKYRSIGVDNIILSQWACNHFLYRRLNLPYKYDVSFVGQPHGDRIKVISALKAAGIKVATFGYGWPSGRVSLYEMNRIFCQSKINLNLSNASVGKVNQIKGRDFEIPGCGGFMITGNNPYISGYFLPGREVVVYENTADLINKTLFYLVHDQERDEIRMNGYNRVIATHTYHKRFQEIFRKIGLGN